MTAFFYDYIQQRISPISSKGLFWSQVFLGSLYIALFSQLEIPLNPVPITLHTFAIFTLGLYLGKKKACFAVLLYLAEATAGLPVFPGFYSDPLWLLGPSAGFLMSFPFAAYLTGYLTEGKTASFPRLTFSLLGAQAVMYTAGVCWLSCFLGFSEALIVGLLPFIAFDSIKLFAALSLEMSRSKLIRFFS